MKNFELEFKGLSLSMADMANISNYYVRACTAEYIMENYSLPETLAMSLANRVRDNMEDYDDDTESIEISNVLTKANIFIRELAGLRGESAQKRANSELEIIEKELENREITIDEKGVARNKIGRVLSPDMAIKVSCIKKKINISQTNEMYNIETTKSIEEYKKNKKPYSEEELMEMRNAFGEGTTVVNVITGEEITL